MSNLRVFTALALLLSPLALALLNSARYAPLPDWAGDVATAASLALAALLAAWGRRAPDAASLHRTQLVLVALAAWWALSLALTAPAYPGPGVQAVAVPLCMALAVAVQRQACARLGRDAVLAVFAAVVLVGALLQAAIGFAQALGLAPLAQGWLLFDLAVPTSVIGNIGQRNLLGHYLGWGLVSACYLHAAGRLRLPLLAPVAFVLALLMAWSGSRVVLGYALGFAVLTLLWLRRAREPDLRRFAAAAAVALLCLAATQLFGAEIGKLLQWLGLSGGGSGAERILDAGFGARRRVEWAKAWQVFLEHPLTGVGWGGYAHESVRLEAAVLPGRVPEDALFTHSHNLLMQLLAETGLVGTVVVVGGGLWAAWPLFSRREANVRSLYLLSMLMISSIHSLFEYPLWYLPFLLGVVLLLGFSPAPAVTLPVRPLLRRLIVTVFAGAVLAYAATGVGHFRTLTTWIHPSPSATENAARIRGLVALGRNPLWAYEADLVLSGYMVPNRRLAALQRPLLERLAAYRPYPGVLQQLALLRQMEGDRRGAVEAMAMAIAAYPGLTPSYAAYFAPLRDPAAAPLQAFTAPALAAFRAGGPAAAADAASAGLRALRD
ncbi:O-antigen ligase [Crenobacter luteus]|uniref:PglL family O-oligosaccharyltransferase n=1 Tax=Crenobacter luteus TaxID=1452487 RepID=UPI00104DA0A8|nr:O-antigen ligase family protein [Crenobacter luteus]TCP15281.1 O-antigen ligase [Crenobacter luteus]